MVKQGNYDYISTNAIISSAKARLKFESSDSDIWFNLLVNEGIRHLDTLSIFTKQICRVEIHDKQSELPCGLNRVLGIRVSAPSNLGEVCQSLVYADLPFLTNCGCNNNGNGIGQGNFGTWYSAAGAYEIADGRIYYHNISSSFQTVDSTGAVVTVTQTPTHATIAYLGLNVDENGEMLCYARYERAIVAYICWKYSQQNFNEYPRDIRADFQQEWINQKAWIKSTDFKDNFANERPQIASVMNALTTDRTIYAL